MSTSSVHAQDQANQNFRISLQSLTIKGYKEVSASVTDLASRHGVALVPVLQALHDGDLYFSRETNEVFITRKADGGIMTVDPLTVEDQGLVDKKSLKKVRVNNNLRRQIKGILGELTLQSKNPEDRLNAATAVFNSRDGEALVALDKALSQETDETVKVAFVKARAAIILTNSQVVEEKLSAIDTLSSYPEQDVLGLLKQEMASDNIDKKVLDTLTAVTSDIEAYLEKLGYLQTLFQGISLGSVLLLAAIGLAITFGVMGVINMAHGEMVMLGAYTTFVVQELFRASFPEYFNWSLAVAIPAAFLVSALVGMAIERGVIRWLYGRPLETLLATWGLSLILQQAIRSIFGPTNREVGNPDWMSGSTEFVSGLALTNNRIMIIIFAMIVLAVLMAVLRHSWFGLQMRAVTQNRSMARSMGIRSGMIDMLTFGLGSGVAGMAGVALSQIDNVSPNLGQAYIIDSFLVVVFGGVGNLWGTLIGALSLGVANKLLEPFAGAVLGKIFVLVAVILFIQRRPRGLFALKGRAVEN